MKYLYKIKDDKIKDALMNALPEFDTVKDNKLKMGELEAIQKITATIKDIYKIIMLDEESEYSGAGNWGANISGTYGNMGHGNERYNNGSSFARRGSHRYSHTSAADMVAEHLERAMSEASSDKEREVIRKAMENLERM